LLEGFSFSFPPLSPNLVTSNPLPAPLLQYSQTTAGIKPLSGSISYALFTNPSGTIFLTSPADEKYQYSFRIDNGLWSNYSPTGEIKLQNLLEGKHIIEVRAKTGDGRITEKSSVVLRIDSLPPAISVKKSFTGKGIKIEVKDLQATEDLIRTSWKFDDGEWSELTTDRYIPLDGISAGIHTLTVQAIDDAGNKSTISTPVEVTEPEGCGCNAGGNTNNYQFLLITAVILIMGISKILRNKNRKLIRQ
jgi:hypothetical protein